MSENNSSGENIDDQGFQSQKNGTGNEESDIFSNGRGLGSQDDDTRSQTEPNAELNQVIFILFYYFYLFNTKVC